MSEFSDKKAREVLQQDTPELSATPLGRHRLVNALAKKFGPSWRNHPQAKSVIKDFDVQHDFHSRMRELKAKQKVGG
jgi:hypothetical protein